MGKSNVSYKAQEGCERLSKFFKENKKKDVKKKQETK
jgi:hypothetical protein